MIVIVVIGILAAITIVSFNGVTAKANATSAKAAASATLKKAEAYSAEKNNYPLLGTDLTSTAAQGESYGLSGVTIDPTTNPTATNGKTTVRMLKCAATNIITQALITAANITGVRAVWWDFAASTPAIATMDTGATAFCPTAN